MKYKDVRLLGPTFVRLPAQDFFAKKAVVPVIVQMAPAYAAGGGNTKAPWTLRDNRREHRGG